MNPRLKIVSAVLLFALAACSSGANSVSVPDARQWATLSEGQHLITRLAAFVGASEQVVHTLLSQDLATQAGRNYLSGAETSWQNVLAQTYNFNTDVGHAVPSMAATVGDVHEAAVQWLNVVNQAKQDIADGKKVHAIAPIVARSLNETQLESALHTDLLRTTGEIVLGLCHLEQRHPGLSSSGSSTADCSAARQLGQSP
jgi:hypothetical protein